jgi:hypothetical protein
MTAKLAVGRAVPHIECRAKITGEAKCSANVICNANHLDIALLFIEFQ